MGQSLRTSDELVKQELLVQYPQDAHSFSLQITKAIGIISKMMRNTQLQVCQHPLPTEARAGRTHLVRT